MFGIRPILILSFFLISWPTATLIAAETERFTIRGGAIFLKADNVSGDVKLGGVTLPGSALSVDDEFHQGLFCNWRVTGNFSLETIVSNPLGINIVAGGGVLGSKFDAVEIDVLPLMLIGRYSPEWNWHGIRPFAGVGAAYLWFDNAKSTAVFDAFGASLALQNPQIDIDNQLRPVLELGLDYVLGDKWFVNATWLYLEGNDRIAVSYSNGAELTSNVSYAPQFFALTLGHRF